MVYVMIGCSLWVSWLFGLCFPGVDCVARFNLVLLGGFRLRTWCGWCFC